MTSWTRWLEDSVIEGIIAYVSYLFLTVTVFVNNVGARFCNEPGDGSAFHPAFVE